MTENTTQSQRDPILCQRTGCEKLSVVEISWGEKPDVHEDSDAESLCRKHADEVIQKVRENNELDYDCFANEHQIRHAHRKTVELQNELIRDELKKEKANIRVPGGTDPLDIIGFDETETDVIIAGTYDHQIVLTLYESEEHAKQMDSEHLYEQKRDMIYIAKCWSGARGGPYVEGGLSNQNECDKTIHQRGNLIEDEKYAPEESLSSDKINNAAVKGDTEPVEDWF